SLFIINGSLQLQSNGTIGTSGQVTSLATSCNLTGEIVWQFYTKVNLSPSTQNFARFYLISDQSDLKGNLNGYYVQLGGSTGNTDSICIYRQSGSQRARVVAGRAATIAKSINTINIKISKSNQGLWTLMTDTLGGNNFVVEGTGNDNTYSSMNYCGIYCKYTSSNVKNFYFDNIDVYAGTDSTPPTADTLKVVNANKLDLIFSEPLDKLASEDINNFLVNNGIGKPQLVALDANNKSKLTLTFASNFQNGTTYTLNISGVKDLKQNVMKPVGKLFSYGSAGANSPILFNEIMSDPSPVVGLPDAEYVELYNPNKVDVDLTNWTITDGTTTATFTNTFGNPVIPADSFI
ncbi:MAG: lamin tail domain-containing protein, partial [Bacteroidetes bacterium]|nr:lamin tail domain-containing protein [Bacteroidota bacterium]